MRHPGLAQAACQPPEAGLKPLTGPPALPSLCAAVRSCHGHPILQMGKWRHAVKVKPRKVSTLHVTWLLRSWPPETSKRGERRCLALRCDWQEASSVSCLGGTEGARRPTKAEGREQRSWAGPQEQGHLWGTMWAPG